MCWSVSLIIALLYFLMFVIILQLFNIASPKRQTHREVGTQSHGSFAAEEDRQTAEGKFFGGIVLNID